MSRIPLVTRHLIASGIPFWSASLLTGMVAVGFSMLFLRAEAAARWIATTHPFLFLLVAPLAFLLSWLLVHRVAPAAAGSGIPQVYAAVELVRGDHAPGLLDRLLGWRTTVVKVLSSVVCVVGGGAIGREGPTIQIGAGIFHEFHARRGAGSLFGEKDIWLVTGAAAGIAAAFNTPLGGLVFAIEELALGTFSRVRTGLITAIIIAGLSAQAITGNYLYVGYPQLLELGLDLLPWSLLVGAAAGLAGALFGWILWRITSWRRSVRHPAAQAILAAGCGLGVALLAIGTDPSVMGPGRDLLISMLYQEEGPGGFSRVVARLTSPVVTYAAGGAGGIFAPSLAAGGSIGSFLAGCFHYPFHRPFVLLGMASFLTGVTRAPFTSFVLVLEMTDHHPLTLPLMLASLTAFAAARLVTRDSFYDLASRWFRGGPGTAAAPAPP
jgi:H+/Cl- antiporter ClcA